MNFPQLPLPDLHLGEGVPGHLHHERGEREALLVLRRGRELGDHPAAQLRHLRVLVLDRADLGRFQWQTKTSHKVLQIALTQTEEFISTGIAQLFSVPETTKRSSWDSFSS